MSMNIEEKALSVKCESLRLKGGIKSREINILSWKQGAFYRRRENKYHIGISVRLAFYRQKSRYRN